VLRDKPVRTTKMSTGNPTPKKGRYTRFQDKLSSLQRNYEKTLEGCLEIHDYARAATIKARLMSTVEIRQIAEACFVLGHKEL